jgi:selenocysteine-specific elongation factor
LIIGTAGHIDHGKTSLVKALTGIDADRLQEEKARGITIDLGFAYKPLSGSGTLGFVDVPGHEKLIRNMLAGATGIDHVLLVVAADDGPMPQTREHLAILDLLGLSRGVVALSKADLVTETRLAEVSAEMHALLAPTALAGAELIAVSSVTGMGIDTLDRYFAQAATAAQPALRGRGHFRLAVDRSFSLPGIGTVVTGTAACGHVGVGDRLLVSPSGEPVRVRGLHVHNRQATEGHAGQRLALNLAGVDKAEIARGDWIVAEAAHAPTQRLDVRVRMLPGEPKPLEHWTPVHLHLGAADVGARVILLEGEPVAPGASAWVQLQLERPIGALRGDRFILRDQSARRTLGGGAVIDAFAPAARRRRWQRLEMLAALEKPTPGEALAALLALEPANGIDLNQFITLWNLLPDDAQALSVAVPHRAVGDGKMANANLAFAAGQLEKQVARIGEILAAHHKHVPDSPGMTVEQLQRSSLDKPGTKSGSRPGAAVFAWLVGEVVAGSTLQRHGPYLRLSGHSASLQGAEQKLWERLKPWLVEGGWNHPPKLSDMLARDRTLQREQVTRLLHKAARMGLVYAVGAEYFILAPHLCELALRAQALAEQDEHRRLNVKTLRETTGVTRHLSLPLVEFFDHIGFTKRDPVGRKIRRDAREMFGQGSPS